MSRLLSFLSVVFLIAGLLAPPGMAQDEEKAARDLLKGAIPWLPQRVVLFEDDPTGSPPKEYVGFAIWRMAMVEPKPGLVPELGVRADIEIRERGMTIALLLIRNTDQELPASHIFYIIVNLPTDLAHGGIASIPGIMMKDAEAARGTALAGVGVKVEGTVGKFMIGLSADALARNLQMLKERTWFDLPVLYGDNRRALIAIAKGKPGELAFTKAFDAWGQ